MSKEASVLALREHNGIKVVSHHDLAARLEVESYDLVKVMKRLAEEDPSFGDVVTLGTFSERVVTVRSDGRHATTDRVHYLLDETRAITVTLESRSKRRHALRAEIVAVYLAAKSMALAPVKQPLLLSESYRKWERKYDQDFVRKACAVYRIKYHRGRFPQFIAGILGRFYSLTWGDAYQALKLEEPNPRHGKNRHQRIPEELDPAFVRLRSKLEAIMEIAEDPMHLAYLMSVVFGNEPLQLRLVGTGTPHNTNGTVKSRKRAAVA